MATDPRVETIRLLTSIDAKLGALLELAGILVNRAPSSAVPASVDLDGPHGDPLVRQKDPRDWTGDSQKGKHFSECPPPYLDMLAERYDYFASKEEDATKQKYNLLDAQRARGWAARLRAGYVAPEPAQTTGGDW
jgi:hypothetical protein